MPDSILNHVWGAAGLFLSGSATLSLVAHAVNTFPTPKNPYGAWALGVVQFAVGQRIVAKNTLSGAQSVVTAVKE